MKMPFGKHKGKELSKLISEEPGYIVWLAENCKLNGELKTIVHKNYRACKEDDDFMTNHIAQLEQDEAYEMGDYDYSGIPDQW